jgi:RND superfamily putative drug exporter
MDRHRRLDHHPDCHLWRSEQVHAARTTTRSSLPDTESTKAQEVLQAKFGGLASNANANILFSPETGTIQQPSVKASIDQLEAKVKQIGSVAAVESPYTTLALPSAQLISPNGEVGRMQVTFKVPDNEVPQADVKQLVSDVQAANTAELKVGVGGQVVDFASSEPPKSEGIGVLVAIVILLIMFGSIVAAGLPILTALIGLSAGISHWSRWRRMSSTLRRSVRLWRQ